MRTILYTLLIIACLFCNAAAIDQYKPKVYQKDDLVVLECAEVDDIGKEILNKEGQYVYKPFPKCIETRQPLALTYGSDVVLQCSLREFDDFYLHLRTLVKMSKPLRCRVPTSKDDTPKYLPIFIYLQRVDSSDKHVKITSNLNSVFHGQSGYIVAGSIYSILDRPIPKAIEGISTVMLQQRWFDGFSPAQSMSDSLEFTNKTFSPLVAMLLCILTATLCYVVGRVYVENWLVPHLATTYKAENPKAVEKKKNYFLEIYTVWIIAADLALFAYDKC